MSPLRSFGAVLLATSLAAQAQEPAGPASPAPADPARAASRASNAFGLALYRQLAAEDGNLFLSPYSISVALAMTREGARDTTRTQMDDVLRLADFDVAAAHRGLRERLAPGHVRDRSASGGKRAAFDIAIAQRVWVQEGLGLEAPFEKVQRQDFEAPLARIDFRQTEAARKAINDWVAERTKDRIQDIVPEGLPTADTLLALANAIWFQAAWAQPFAEGMTREQDFTTLAGAVKKVRAMRKTEALRYAQLQGAELVEVPYLGGECAMWIFLPERAAEGQAAGAPLRAFEQRLSAELLQELETKLAARSVALELPKFEVTKAFDLRETLIAMGMRAPFRGSEADFTGITEEEPLVIGPVLHKAFVKVDEAGTEAAAATVVLMKRGAARPAGEPQPFVVDRPFFFVIRHQSTGTVLFAGRVAEPQ